LIGPGDHVFLRTIAPCRPFRNGDAISSVVKAAYLRSIGSEVNDFGGSDAGWAILEPCATERPSEAEGGTESEQGTPPGATSKMSCNTAQNEYEIEEEGDPTSSRCMDIKTDTEFTKNYFDYNILKEKAVGYAVPETTWENVAYNRFKVMLVRYKNDTSEYFVLGDIGVFHSGRGMQMSMLPSKFVKRSTTRLVYPLDRGHLYFLSEHVTPNIISLKNGLKYQVKDLQGLYTLLQAGGAFASIMSLYAVGPESFKTSISAFERPVPAKLPGRPLPGIRVKGSSGTTTSTQGGEVGGLRKSRRTLGRERKASSKEAPKGRYRPKGEKEASSKETPRGRRRPAATPARNPRRPSRKGNPEARGYRPPAEDLASIGPSARTRTSACWRSETMAP
jgi:hypothetical protein